MTSACQNCGHPECWPEDRFCVKCGRRLEAGRSGEPELATVTIPVADAAYVQVKLGGVYRKKGNREAAMRAYQKALEIDPACVAAQTSLAELMAESNGVAPAAGA
jgi:Tfp pilus assembly protein PilF